jgi:uncharacterized membrane protein
MSIGSRIPTPDRGPELADVMERNIRTLVARRREEERKRGPQDRVADWITQFTGSMGFVYFQIVLVGLWVAINLGLLPIRPFDPSFVILAVMASVEAIFLSTFVLITQNRMALLADKRADLDLQVSLLAEHEITRLIELVTAIAEQMGMEEAKNPELAELSRAVPPERVMEKIDREEEV